MTPASSLGCLVGFLLTSSVQNRHLEFQGASLLSETHSSSNLPHLRQQCHCPSNGSEKTALPSFSLTSSLAANLLTLVIPNVGTSSLQALPETVISVSQHLTCPHHVYFRLCTPVHLIVYNVKLFPEHLLWFLFFFFFWFYLFPFFFWGGACHIVCSSPTRDWTP